MNNSFLQLSKLKEITDETTKKKSFSGEISIIYVRASWIEMIGPGNVNSRSISYLVCHDGSHFAVDIHPSDLVAVLGQVITTANVMGAAKGELIPNQDFDKEKGS